MLRELTAWRARRVIVSDLRRSWLAACGFWLVSWPLGFHPVTRHDGVVSVLRGFTRRRARRATCMRATGAARPTVRRHLGCPTSPATLAAEHCVARHDRSTLPSAARARPDARRPRDDDGGRAARARAARSAIFELAAEVERWPALLPHYRYVRFVERRSDGGGIVEMSANRPFGVVRWPTWWSREMRSIRRRTGAAVDPVHAHRGYDDGDGRGVDLPAPTPVEPTCASCMCGTGRRWSMAGEIARRRW